MYLKRRLTIDYINTGAAASDVQTGTYHPLVGIRVVNLDGAESVPHVGATDRQQAALDNHHTGLGPSYTATESKSYVKSSEYSNRKIRMK